MPRAISCQADTRQILSPALNQKIGLHFTGKIRIESSKLDLRTVVEWSGGSYPIPPSLTDPAVWECAWL